MQTCGSSDDSDGAEVPSNSRRLEIMKKTVKQAEDDQRLCSYLKLICVKSIVVNLLVQLKSLMLSHMSS